MDIFTAIFTIAKITSSILFIAFAALILRIFHGKSIRNRNYPPVVGTVFNQIFYFNQLYDYQTEIATRRHTFRLLSLDQSCIYTTEPSNIEHIVKNSFERYPKGKYNEIITKDLFGQGIFVVDNEKWLQQRKLASLEFSTRVLRDFSCIVFRRNAVKLVRKISEFSMCDRSFDVQDLLMRCTLDSIFKVGFGVELDCLGGSQKEAIKFIEAFDDSNQLIYWRFFDPLWKLKRYLNIGSEASLKKNINIIHNFVDVLIKTKRKQLEMKTEFNVKEDILSRFLLEGRKDPEKMTAQYIRDAILNFMTAGKDTTAYTLSWFFYMLCKHPLIQERVVDEVTEVTGGCLSERSIEEFIESFSNEILENMHYLHATLTETLRLYPAIPVNTRCAEADDILPDGFKVKKGDAVFYMPYAMGRMPYIWGDDAQDFRPERWLKDGIFQPESPFKFTAFHAGPRICLGKRFAYMQMKIVSMALLHYFRFKLANEADNITYKTMFTLHIKGGLHIYAIPRRDILQNLFGGGSSYPAN